VGTKYKRVGKVEEKIHSAKLPYNAWKVFFLIDGEVEANNIAEYLEEGVEDVEDALQKLVQEGLVETTSVKEKAETEAEDEIEAVEEEKTEEKEIEIETPDEEPDFEELEEADKEDETLDLEFEESPDEPLEESKIEPEEEQESQEDILSVIEDEEQPEEEKVTEEETVADFSLDDLDLEESSEQETDMETATVEEADEEATLEIDLPDEEEQVEEQFEGTDLDVDFATEEVSEEPETAEEPAVEEPEKPAAEVSADAKTILVVDDSIVIRKMVEIALEDENYKIETAVSGKDGLAIMDEKNPQLMILDLMLPDINGIDLLKTVKASKGIPVIMLSGKDSPQMVEKARSEGADAFLPKPFKDDELVAKIRELIG